MLLVIFEALACLLILFGVVRISIIARRQKLQHRKTSKERSNTKDRNKRSSTALKTIIFSLLSSLLSAIHWKFIIQCVKMF